MCYSLEQVDCEEAGTTAEEVTEAPPTTTAATQAQSSTAAASELAEDAVTPMSMVAVCGSDYQDALKNICTNLPCPKGDVSVGIFVLHAFGARLDVVSCLFLLSRRFGP